MTIRATQPSSVVMPEAGSANPTTVLAYLCARFPQVGSEVWRGRMDEGKVHLRDGTPLHAESAYQPLTRIFYYREVNVEPVLPFKEEILFQDEQIIIVFKPHFLPVYPTGAFINECLVHRLRMRTGLNDIVPAHWLDRATAGLMLMSLKPATRHVYHRLFKEHAVHKEYRALAHVAAPPNERHWTVRNRLGTGVPSFTRRVVHGEANTHSEIKLLRVDGKLGTFALTPVTGKTHQLRVHMQSLGFPIVNDRCYPLVLPKGADDYGQPLRLVSNRLRFTDPVSGDAHDWSAASSLDWTWDYTQVDSRAK